MFPSAWAWEAAALLMLVTPRQPLAELLLMTQPCTLPTPAVGLKAAVANGDWFGIPGMGKMLEHLPFKGRGAIPVSPLT